MPWTLRARTRGDQLARESFRAGAFGGGKARLLHQGANTCALLHPVRSTQRRALRIALKLVA